MPLALASTSLTQVSRSTTHGSPARHRPQPRLQPLRASATSTPRNAEDLFKPFSFEGAMSERAGAYLSLLAESSTSPGGMQRHLLRLLATGAAKASKLSQMVASPLDSIQDAVCDAGSELLLLSLAAAPRSTPSGSSSASTAGETSSPISHWSRLRRTVLGVSSFKCALKTRDDSYQPPPAVNAVHAKALSLMLSLMMSSAVSGLAVESMPGASFLSSIGAGAGAQIEAVMPAAVAESKAAAKFTSCDRVPSLVVRATKATGASSAEGATSMGGMAASTAMKLLRADSRRGILEALPDLDEIFGHVLDTVHETSDGATGQAPGQRYHAV